MLSASGSMDLLERETDSFEEAYEAAMVSIRRLDISYVNLFLVYTCKTTILNLGE